MLRPGRVCLFAFAGALIGLALGGRVGASVGPFETTFSARPAWSGETLVRLAPLGTILLDTHDGPLRVEVRVDELRLEAAEKIVEDPSELDDVENELATDVRDGLYSLVRIGALLTFVGAVIGALLARPNLRSAVYGLAVGVVVTGVVGLMAFRSWTPGAIGEPKYTGLLTVAPRAVGDAEDVVDNFGQYRAQLADLVGNVATLYQAAEQLPQFDPSKNTVRVLHVSDLHLNPQGFDLMEQLSKQFNVDAVFDAGDITDWGTEPEAQVLERVGTLDVPYLWVRGNHDSPQTQTAIDALPNVTALDNSTAKVGGLTVWGVSDPRYTPDKSADEIGKDVEAKAAAEFAAKVRRMLSQLENPPDVALAHDARFFAESGGLAPLFLAGHTHTPRQGKIGESNLLVEGSTGGAGLRALQKEEPEPLSCSVLYFDRATGRLIAYDRVTVGAFGQADVQIQRVLVE